MKDLEERLLYIEKFLSKRFGKTFDEYVPEYYKEKVRTGTPRHHSRLPDVNEELRYVHKLMENPETGKLEYMRVLVE